jgi:hypothetical protein
VIGGLETTTCEIVDHALDKRRFLEFMESRERALAMARRDIGHAVPEMMRQRDETSLFAPLIGCVVVTRPELGLVLEQTMTWRSLMVS